MVQSGRELVVSVSHSVKHFLVLILSSQDYVEGILQVSTQESSEYPTKLSSEKKIGRCIPDDQRSGAGSFLLLSQSISRTHHLKKPSPNKRRPGTARYPHQPMRAARSMNLSGRSKIEMLWCGNGSIISVANKTFHKYSRGRSYTPVCEQPSLY